MWRRDSGLLRPCSTARLLRLRPSRPLFSASRNFATPLGVAGWKWVLGAVLVSSIAPFFLGNEDAKVGRDPEDFGRIGV